MGGAHNRVLPLLSESIWPLATRVSHLTSLLIIYRFKHLCGCGSASCLPFWICHSKWRQPLGIPGVFLFFLRQNLVNLKYVACFYIICTDLSKYAQARMGFRGTVLRKAFFRERLLFPFWPIWRDYETLLHAGVLWPPSFCGKRESYASNARSNINVCDFHAAPGLIIQGTGSATYEHSRRHRLRHGRFQ